MQQQHASDHNALLWTLEVETVSKESHRQMFDYSKADVVGIKSELQTVDWQKLFCDTDAEQNWLSFRDYRVLTDEVYTG